jgi:uncharacterized membrane protein
LSSASFVIGQGVRPALRRHRTRRILQAMTDAVSPAAPQPFFLDAVLAPHRSLPPSGFIAVMAVFGGISVVAGTIFVLRGAWPVMGFFGIDVALVYLAFRINYRSARRQERIRLAEDALTVERIDVRGARRSWRFQPYWLRVTLEEKPDESNRLIISSHGRSLVLGSFLGAGERRSFAATLQDALARWRAHLSPG